MELSVVIPAYNEANRIGRAIQSVLNQSHPVNEIIVVDDGSIDESASVIASYGNLVICIHQNNLGLSFARNTGIRCARSEWIAFLDADDEWLPDHISNACKQIGLHPEIVWYCAAYEKRTENGELLYYNQVDESLIQNGVIRNYFIAQAKTFFSNATTMLVKRSVFNEVGLFNGDIRQHGEDLDMWFRIATRYPQLGYCDYAGGIYYYRKGSITTATKINIGKFIKRIEITLASAKDLSGETNLTKESRFLIRHWLNMAIKETIRQGDKSSLGLVAEMFNDYLSLEWKFITKVFQYRFAMRLARIALQVRDKKTD